MLRIIYKKRNWPHYVTGLGRKLHTSQINKKIIDLRSDTVTVPTLTMRQAMYDSQVGDDVYGEDPTVNSLQDRMSQLFLGNQYSSLINNNNNNNNKYSLFVPTGTMGNLISCISHCSDSFDNEIIIGDESHIHFYEQGGVASVGRIHCQVLSNNHQDGTIDLKDIERCIRPMHLRNVHFPLTKLICLENTHNRCGGVVLPLEYLQELRKMINRYNEQYQSRIKIHMDGARIYNALVHYGDEYLQHPHKIMQYVDSINVCFSKGLGAPIGSMIISSCDQFIQRSYRLRKVLGGGMRQVGVIASCAHISLDEIVPKLKLDHTNASKLAQQLNQLKISGLQVQNPQTNIVNFTIDEKKLRMTDEQVVKELKEKANIWLNCMSKNKFRMVLYHQISSEDVDEVVNRFRNVFLDNKYTYK